MTETISRPARRVSIPARPTEPLAADPGSRSGVFGPAAGRPGFNGEEAAGGARIRQRAIRGTWPELPSTPVVVIKGRAAPGRGRVSRCAASHTAEWRDFVRRSGLQTYPGSMTLLVILLVIWLVLAIVGFALKGLVWLGIIGIVLFVGTAILGILRRRAATTRRA